MRIAIQVVIAIVAIGVAVVLLAPRADFWSRDGGPQQLLWLAAPVLLVSVVILLAIARRQRQRRAEREAPAEPIQEAISARPGVLDKHGCLIGSSLFLLLGLGFTAVFAYPAVRNLQALSWTAVDCEILESYVESHSGDSNDTYSIEVRYRYRWDGAEYTGDRYEFMGGSSSGRRGKKKVVDALPPGTTTTCWVDPEDPTDAVLHRGWSWVYLLGLFPLIFVAIGAVGLAGSLGLRREGRGASTGGGFTLRGGATAGSGSAPFAPDHQGLPQVASGPITLEETLSPWGKLGMLLFFTVFWNGVVGAFLAVSYSEWRETGDVPGCLLLFLVPFVLVGVLLLVSVPYQLLALANPKPILHLAAGGVRPGGSTTLQWSFKGAASRLRDLKLTLEGGESATYRQGTRSSTAKRVFERIEVATIDSPMLTRQGSATIRIPEGTMHSFRFGHNEIAWTLKLHGSIRNWPDVITEFPFVVLPAVEGSDD